MNVDFDHQKSGLDYHPWNQTKCQVILLLYLKPLSRGLITEGAMQLLFVAFAIEDPVSSLCLSIRLSLCLSLCLEESIYLPILIYLPRRSNRFHIATLRPFSSRDSQTVCLQRLSNRFHAATLKLFSYSDSQTVFIPRLSNCFHTATLKPFLYHNSQTIFILQLSNRFHTATLKPFSLRNSQTIYIP